jgi:23S rRNA (uracil1939-C5)-methyltransferase
MRLQIEKPVYGGSGLAREMDGADAGRAVFVPFVLSGEVVEARLTGEKDGYAEAALVEVIEPSAERVAPGCVHFGQCGGCQYQHARYGAQVEMKRAILLETLGRAGLEDLPEVEMHAGEAWGYRNRIRLRVAEADGALRVGYSERGTTKFLAVRECPIGAPVLWRAAEAMLQLAVRDRVAESWVRSAVEVEFFSTADESKVQMTLFVRKDRVKGFAEFCEALRGLVPELAGAGVAILPADAGRQGRRIERAKDGVGWGVAGLGYEAVGRRYWVSRGGFFQVNRFLIEELVRVVTAGRKGVLVWDLYAGVGLFSQALAEGFEQVAAVEGGETAARDLAGGLKKLGGRAVWDTTVEFLRDAVVQRERPELVVMDPPRAGVGAEVCALLARVAAKEMVYVSCDPVTLSRDLRMMVDSGYRIRELHLVDLFPQTFHMETVVVLRR